MGVAYGEVVAHRYVVILEILVQHGIHIVVAQRRMLVFSELSADYSAQFAKLSAQLQQMKHTVNLSQALANVLDEEHTIR